MTIRTHTLVCLVEDQPGVLNRVMSLFRRRMFNADSVTVGSSEQPGLSRMTFVINGDDETVEQVSKQLYKLLEVIKVTDITTEPHIRRELALIKVSASAANRADLIQLTGIYRGEILDVSHNQLVIEIAGSAEKIDGFLNLVQPFGIREISRTGTVVMTRPSAGTDTTVRLREDVA
jgi:acetolactate synthase-1/3 small subunit